jgi:Ca-activated chloride channel family protein
MTTRVDVLQPASAPAVTWRTVALIFGVFLGRAFVMALAVGLLLTAAAVALPAPLQEPAPALDPAGATSGSFLMRRGRDQPYVAAPVLECDVNVRVAGLVARMTVRQAFRNATDEWVEGVYVFPLPPEAAVDHLLMKVGERTIEGQIRERQQAKAEYQQARDSGRRASLVE